jgi:hypothetical protein
LELLAKMGGYDRKPADPSGVDPSRLNKGQLNAVLEGQLQSLAPGEAQRLRAIAAGGDVLDSKARPVTSTRAETLGPLPKGVYGPLFETG